MAANAILNGDVTTTDLFGGAAKCFLPHGAVDVSEMRDIPDNQEVFCHPSRDQSIMMDILEFQGHIHNESAIKYHFEDIANSNEALGSCEIMNIEQMAKERISMKECSDAWLLKGKQMASKFNEGEEAKNIVEVTVALFRLPQYTTDILITFNNPISISSVSSSHKSSSTDPSPAVDQWTSYTFDRVVTSLSLVNPQGLFGE